MATDAEIQAMANKYGWDEATVTEFKRRRDNMPDRDPDTQPQDSQSQQSTNQIVLDPDKAQQFRQGMANMADGGEVKDNNEDLYDVNQLHEKDKPVPSPTPNPDAGKTETMFGGIKLHYANGGQVPQPQMIPPMIANKPMGPAPLQQPAPQVQNPQAMQLTALQKLRGF